MRSASIYTALSFVVLAGNELMQFRIGLCSVHFPRSACHYNTSASTFTVRRVDFPSLHHRCINTLILQAQLSISAVMEAKSVQYIVDSTLETRQGEISR